MGQTCSLRRSQRVQETYNSDGYWVPELHDYGWLVCAAFALFASTIAVWMLSMHARYYTKPNEQRHIVFSLLSYVYYPWAMVYLTISTSYEAFALTSFFVLIRTYLTPSVKALKQDLKQRTITYWAWPLSYNFVKKRLHLSPMNGLTWYWWMCFGVFQYAIVRPILLVVAIILEQNHVYCEGELSPQFGYIYCLVLQSVSVAVAMYCVLAFYLELKQEPAIKQHRPFYKLLCIKLVIFFIFWQSVVLSILAIAGLIKDQNIYWSSRDIQTGLNAIITNAEMAVFAVMHINAFSWKEYIPKDETKVTGRMMLIWDAFNLYDFAKEFWKACRWVFVQRKMEDHDKMSLATSCTYGNLQPIELGVLATVSKDVFSPMRNDVLIESMTSSSSRLPTNDGQNILAPIPQFLPQFGFQPLPLYDSANSTSSERATTSPGRRPVSWRVPSDKRRNSLPSPVLSLDFPGATVQDSQKSRTVVSECFESVDKISRDANSDSRTTKPPMPQSLRSPPTFGLCRSRSKSLGSRSFAVRPRSPDSITTGPSTVGIDDGIDDFKADDFYEGTYGENQQPDDTLSLVRHSCHVKPGRRTRK